MSLDLLPPEQLSDAAAWAEVWVNEARISPAAQREIVQKVAPEYLAELLRQMPPQ